MNKIKVIIITTILLLAIITTACSQTKITCNDPYMLSQAHCCLDKNKDNTCDNEQESTTENCKQDCSLCPPNIVKKEVEVYKYVCSDGKTIVDNITTCNKIVKKEILFNPITTNEDINESPIEKVTVRPACRGGYNAIEIYFQTGVPINNTIIQVKTSPEKKWEDIYNYNSNVIKGYLYGAFCSNMCTTNANFFIKPNKKYLMRLKFDYRGSSLDKIYYSNEHIIDASKKGDYTTKLC